ncbi:MAG TPA: hypothetical protein PLL30_11905 [Candidatus Krumholzibacteria bacterium]|nr:hypothetical protein [Candidatus Krumholzibacteria bacterium]HPD72471.1 hypothetical protein [Candidatus Krumholzibacteria bacterium]HRY40597.1 hypothetical protein [Candidatus Krumholzibacteria bacterium]
MGYDDWSERLEMYLDGELDDAAHAAFEAETAANPALATALAQRRAFRDEARLALTGGAVPTLADHAHVAARQPAPPKTKTQAARPRLERGWPLLAAAATLALAILAPTVLRDDRGAEGPRSAITRAGQVAAVRFGEEPGKTVMLEAGWYDRSPDLPN